MRAALKNGSNEIGISTGFAFRVIDSLFESVGAITLDGSSVPVRSMSVARNRRGDQQHDGSLLL
jgi:hypothetical protein